MSGPKRMQVTAKVIFLSPQEEEMFSRFAHKYNFMRQLNNGGDMKEIRLEIDKDIHVLAGNPYGRSVFDAQVKGLLGLLDEPVTIVIPSHIVYISNTFIQGFFACWLNSIGLEGVRKNIRIQAGNEQIVEYILESLR